MLRAMQCTTVFGRYVVCAHQASTLASQSKRLGRVGLFPARCDMLVTSCERAALFHTIHSSMSVKFTTFPRNVLARKQLASLARGHFL
eukprot:4281608-Pyramimonas_sp.AAC.1